MKKLFFFAIVALGMTAACQKPDNTPVDESNEPVAIQFGMNAPTISVTKTKAAVEEWTANTGNIHVVGYNYHTDELLWVETGNPETTATTATIEFTAPLYYAGNIAYDFRAYYLGTNADAGITDDALSLNIPVTITGQEDVMAGVTNRTTDILNASGGTVEDHQMYSAYAARRSVHPSLTFNHMLTRINVDVKYPAQRADEESLQVSLENLKVKSNTQGTLSLAGSTPAITLDKETQYLNISLTDNKGEVMIQPSLTEIVFTFDLKASALTQNGQTITLLASNITEGENTTSFLPGKQYDVTIKVYDLEEIVVSATVSEWGEGGTVTYDPDNNNWTPDGYTPEGN